jgi:iron complex transport system permease protein
MLSSDSVAYPLDGETYVLWYLRIPRVFLSVLVGASLGLSGALVQGLFRNPLADPSLLGVTTGAACAAALTIVLISDHSIWFSVEARVWLLPFVSFMGAFITCMLLNIGAGWLSPGSFAGLLLFGIALNALGVAVIGLCTYLATDEQLRSLSFWTLGSLAGANWTIVPTLGLVLLAVYLWCLTQVQHLNALNLGEATAASLGVCVSRLRWSISVMVALLAGLSVAFCGVIGFIGLIAPHLARALVGADLRALLPISMLFGALLMLVADTLARTIVIPAEVPVGIFTALLGGPFLMLLLHTKRHGVG